MRCCPVAYYLCLTFIGDILTKFSEGRWESSERRERGACTISSCFEVSKSSLLILVRYTDIVSPGWIFSNYSKSSRISSPLCNFSRTSNINCGLLLRFRSVCNLFTGSALWFYRVLLVVTYHTCVIYRDGARVAQVSRLWTTCPQGFN